MKNIIALALVFFSTFTCFAQTKNELIEKLLIASNSKARFDGMVQELMSFYNIEDDNLKEIIKKNCTWESWRKIQTAVMNDCYTKEDIEILINMWETPEIKEFQKKSVTFARIKLKAQEQWEKEVRQKISDDIQKLPRNEEKPPTRAAVWNSWSDKEKWNFVEGYKQGIAFASSYYLGSLESRTNRASAQAEQKPKDKISLSTYSAKLCRAVSEFYEDPENENIPHAYALHYADFIVEGKDISELLKKARKTFNKSEQVK